MRIEEVLTDALREDAEARDVDVTRLWAQTQARLDELEPEHRQAARRRRLGVLAAAAAVTVAVTAGGVALTRIDAGREPGPAVPGSVQDPVEGGVDDVFTCPEQITHDWTRSDSVTDEYFAASLLGGPKQQAETHDAPRYEYQEQGDRAFLRFGNADGSLATLSEFHRVDGEWTRHRTDVCVGEDGSVAVPVRGELSLGNHGGDPYAEEQQRFGLRKKVYVVDERPYYDHLGLVRRRSIFATDCRDRMCLIATEGDGSRTMRLEPGQVPYDVSRLFLPPDEMTSRHNPYGLWMLYDVEGTVESVVAYRKGGTPTGSHSAYVEGWPGQLHLVLAPFDEVVKVTVTRRPGTTSAGEPLSQSFTPQELPWYQARVHR